MSEFWIGFCIGYGSMIGTYLGIGLILGIISVIMNLARFHGAGFQISRILHHTFKLILYWPVLIYQIWYE